MSSYKMASLDYAFPFQNVCDLEDFQSVIGSTTLTTIDITNNNSPSLDSSNLSKLANMPVFNLHEHDDEDDND